MNEPLWIIVDGLGLAGAEKQATQLALKLAEVYEIRIVYLKAADGSDETRLSRLFTESRGRVIGQRLSILLFIKLFAYRKSLTIITFSVKSNILGRILKLLNKRIYLITSIRNEKFSNNFAYALYRMSCRVTELAVYNSKTAMVRGCIQGLSSRTQSLFINNYVDRVAPQFRQIKVIRRLAYLGRLVPQKRVDWLIEAVSNIQSEIPDVELDIYGYGPMATKVIRKINEVNERGGIHYKGPYSTIDAILDRVDMVIIPSEWEGMPNVALECAQRLIPVIGSNAGGLADIQEECGIAMFVELKSVLDLQDLIRSWLLRDSEVICSATEQLSRYVTNNHNSEHITKLWLETIQNRTGFTHA